MCCHQLRQWWNWKTTVTTWWVKAMFVCFFFFCIRDLKYWILQTLSLFRSILHVIPQTLSSWLWENGWTVSPIISIWVSFWCICKDKGPRNYYSLCLLNMITMLDMWHLDTLEITVNLRYYSPLSHEENFAYTVEVIHAYLCTLIVKMTGPLVW